MEVLEERIVMITGVRKTPGTSIHINTVYHQSMMMHLKDLCEIDCNQILKFAGY